MTQVTDDYQAAVLIGSVLDKAWLLEPGARSTSSATYQKTGIVRLPHTRFLMLPQSLAPKILIYKIDKHKVSLSNTSPNSRP